MQLMKSAMLDFNYVVPAVSVKPKRLCALKIFFGLSYSSCSCSHQLHNSAGRLCSIYLFLTKFSDFLDVDKQI